MNEEAIEITSLVVTVLEELQIRYLIGGSLASAIYGEPRATRDADILADIRTEHIEPLCEMLEPQFYIAKEAIESALKHRSSFNVIHLQSVFKVDIFVPKNRQFEEQEFERRTVHILAHNPEKRAYVASAEDIILAKLEWYRLGNEVSEQQWRDLTGIFKATQARLDLEYLSQTASQLGVLDLLRKLIPTA